MNRAGRDERLRGMSLVEMLVVVAIILMFSAIALPLLTPNDAQKGREAALTTTTAIGRVIARAEANGIRGAGLWLEPLDPGRDPQLASSGILDLFACQSQDDYQGDDPDTQPKVWAQPLPSPISVPLQNKGWRDGDAILLFSTLTSGNIRATCQKASRIAIPRGGTEYYFRLLPLDEQRAKAAELVADRLLPPPYVPYDSSVIVHEERQIGFYNLKQLTIPPGDEPWAAHSRRPQDRGDIILAYARPIPPSTTPASTLNQGSFNAGIPQDAVFDEEGTPIPPQSHEYPSNFPAFDTGVEYTVRRPITRSATPPLSLPAGFGVDLAWSTFGSSLLANSTRPLPGTGTRLQGLDGLLSNRPVSIMFSQAKDVAGLVYYRTENIGGYATVVEERLGFPGDVYLLVGRLDRAGLPYRANPTKSQPGANWQYPDSRWVRISRTGGNTLIADPVLGVDNVYDSQGYARLGLQAARQ